VHIHVDRQEIINFWQKMIPAAIVFKFVLDLLAVGYIKVALDAKANKPVEFSNLYANYWLVPSYFIVNIITHLVTVLGFFIVGKFTGGFSFVSILFLIPGLFIYQRLRLAKFFVIDKNYRIDQALQASWCATADCWANLTAFSVIEMMVNAIGHVLILSSFVIFPLGFQVETDVYRQLVK
jgi:hypothetical protein